MLVSEAVQLVRNQVLVKGTQLPPVPRLARVGIGTLLQRLVMASWLPKLADASTVFDKNINAF